MSGIEQKKILSHKKAVQGNPVNTDTNGTFHSVRINWVFEKVYELFFHQDKHNCMLYTGVHIKWVSVEQGFTILPFSPVSRILMCCKEIHVSLISGLVS